MKDERTTAEVEKSIQEIVQYLREKQDIDERRNKSFYGRADVVEKLDSVIHHLNEAFGQMSVLRGQFQLGNMDPYYAFFPRLNDLYEGIIELWIMAKDARIFMMGEYPQRTRLLELQRSAVRLSVAYFDQMGRGQARNHAKRIMSLAGLPEPDGSSISRWIKEFREDFAQPPAAM